MTPNKRTFIGIILDKSGSMQSIWKKTIAGINKQILAIQEGATDSEVDTYVSFYVFDKNTHKVFEAKSINFLTEIAEEDYQPKGDTALYGCLNDMIDSLSEVAEEADPDNSYLVYVFSDGDETVARDRRAATGQRIKEKQDGGKWTFSFVGCDQDLTVINEHLNIPLGNIAKFSKSSIGTETAFENQASSVKKYLKSRASGQMQMNSMYSEAGKMADFSVSGKIHDEALPKSDFFQSVDLIFQGIENKPTTSNKFKQSIAEVESLKKED